MAHQDSQRDGLYCGIDPGQTGAVVLLGVHGGVTGVVRHLTMPTTERHGRTVVDAAALAAGLRPIVALGAVFALEDVWARRGESAGSAFNFGDSFGAVRGVLAALGVTPSMALPTVWKPAIGATGVDKAVIWAALSRAGVQRLPEEKAANLGVADAAGIALWLSRLPVR